jgi:hypothetical protein
MPPGHLPEADVGAPRGAQGALGFRVPRSQAARRDAAAPIRSGLRQRTLPMSHAARCARVRASLCVCRTESTPHCSAVRSP